MKIYLASSLRNHLVNSQIDSFLRNNGIDVFLPQRDTHTSNPTEPRSNRYAYAETIFRSNVRAIDNSDIVVVVAHNIGTDTAWECGYAVGHQKKVILLFQENDDIVNMYMLIGALSQVIHEISFSDNKKFEASMTALVKEITGENN